MNIFIDWVKEYVNKFLKLFIIKLKVIINKDNKEDK